MENSIEENIEILENFINWLKTDFEYNSDDEIKVIEHILSDYKRTLKENNKLKSAIGIANKLEQEIKKQYVPKQKIQNKIEELYQENNNWTEELSEPDSNFRRVDRNLKRIKNQIDVLQELLERGKIYGRKNSEGN